MLAKTQIYSVEEPARLDHLLDGCLRGDESAWESLVNSYKHLIYSICYHYARMDGEADDLAQDVFVRIFQQLGGFRRNQGSFRGWITRVTRNLITDHFRKTRKRPLGNSVAAIPDRMEDKTAARNTPEQIIQFKQNRALLGHALQKLSPEGRKIIIMREVKEIEYREIARLLSIPEGTVKSRISRNRAELLRVMRQRGSDCGARSNS